MCRMLAMIGKKIPAEDILIKFRTLAESGIVRIDATPGHQDGWGILAFHKEKHIWKRSVKNALEDPSFVETAREIGDSFSGLILVHLRKTSRGANIVSNNHPFFENGFGFMHNGTIYYSDNSISDSLQFFNSLQENGLNDPILAYRRNLEQISAGKIGFSSVTSFLADKGAIYGIRKMKSHPEYYTMFYQEQPNYTVFCQEKIIPGNW